MCEPTTLAYIAIASSVASTGISAYSSSKQGSYQNQVAKNNKITADRMAQDALDRGTIAEEAHRRKVAATISAQKAATGASGVELASGSALAVTSGTAILGEMDALTIRNNAAREAEGFTQQGLQEQSAGRMALATGRTQAAGSILAGAGKVAGQWYGFKKEGVL